MSLEADGEIFKKGLRLRKKAKNEERQEKGRIMGSWADQINLDKLKRKNLCGFT